ncbi:MAG TPA: LPS assembly protein LptD [Acetobacteraceae bacterium]|nr:LPS assembly protein LptD [Acetobacteraceae bacterium]
MGRACAPLVALALIGLALVMGGDARAQLGQFTGGTPPVSKNQPVTFTADSVEYQQQNSLVIAKGHVEAWQNGHVLRADEVTFNRQTGVATARGHVTLIEPNGQVLFADAAELDQGMRDGILTAIRARLAENGKLAANGGRRTAGVLNSMSKVVYSTCNLCKKHPERPPLWQIRASNATEDAEHKRIEYTNAEMQVFGVPVAYFPYFWTAEPSAKRSSGLLIPSFGVSSHIGGFFAQPYYLVIDDQSDVTLTPMLTTSGGPEIDAEYRRRFNSGYLTVNGSAAYFQHSLQGTIFANGQFSLDPSWRAGFNVNRASSADYVNDFHLGHVLGSDPSVLSSNIYAEGFGQGAYSRIDTRFYQGLTDTIINSKLPLVLPHYQYSYFGEPDSLGGRLSVDAGAFNVMRSDGTNTRRGSLIVEWDRPFTGALGDLWTLKLHADAAAYNAGQFNQQPNFATVDSINSARAVPEAALDFRWPFARNSGAWGTQLIEPMAEIIVGPNQGDSQLNKYPNEDSLDEAFSDANLFGFNRFGGIDRLQGGSRANVALHAAWYLSGTALDGLIGQSYNTTKSSWLPSFSGLQDQVSDIVGRLSFTPAEWLDTTYRFRLDHRNLAMRVSDVTASAGVGRYRVSAGYIYSSFDPYYFYDQPAPPPPSSPYFIPRNEITLSADAGWGAYRFNAFARRDLTNAKMVSIGGDAIYEDECFIMDFKFYRRYTSLNGDNGSTTLLIQLTFKTIGQFGFKAL